MKTKTMIKSPILLFYWICLLFKFHYIMNFKIFSLKAEIYKHVSLLLIKMQHRCSTKISQNYHRSQTLIATNRITKQKKNR